MPRALLRIGINGLVGALVVLVIGAFWSWVAKGRFDPRDWVRFLSFGGFGLVGLSIVAFSPARESARDRINQRVYGSTLPEGNVRKDFRARWTAMLSGIAAGVFCWLFAAVIIGVVE